MWLRRLQLLPLRDEASRLRQEASPKRIARGYGVEHLPELVERPVAVVQDLSI